MTFKTEKIIGVKQREAPAVVDPQSMTQQPGMRGMLVHPGDAMGRLTRGESQDAALVGSDPARGRAGGP